MSKIKKSPDRTYKLSGGHKKYLERITKTLYYGKLSKTDALSLPVTELATEIFSESQRGRSLDRLDYGAAARISRNACVPPCSLVIALLYLERLKGCNPDYVEKTSPYDLFLVSLMVSCKFLFDDGETDEVFIDEWAASAGISVKDLIRLERNFLHAINWEVYVREPTFWQKLRQLETALASREGSSRGRYTYTELESLLGSIDVRSLVRCVVAVSVVLTATYAAGLLTLVGSVFLAGHVPGTSLYRERSSSPGNGSVTSLILENFESPKFNESVTWDYWNVPAMRWLSDVASRDDEEFDVGDFKVSLSDVRYVRLEDIIYKGKVRDRVKSSWYEEWTDRIRFEVSVWFETSIF